MSGPGDRKLAGGFHEGMPVEEENPRAHFLGDWAGTVFAVHVDDDDLARPREDAPEGKRQVPLLVEGVDDDRNGKLVQAWESLSQCRAIHQSIRRF